MHMYSCKGNFNDGYKSGEKSLHDTKALYSQHFGELRPISRHRATGAALL